MSINEEIMGGARVRYIKPETQYKFKTSTELHPYGEVLNSLDSLDPKYEYIYNSFNLYFNNPIMVKTKDTNDYSMYMCKSYCLLANEHRYIIVLVRKDTNPINTKEKLIDLQWESLQTRSLIENYDVHSHNYQPRKIKELNFPITRIDTQKESSTYKCDDLPITVTLLHTKNQNQYQNKGTIIASLETFQTIITINHKREI